MVKQSLAMQNVVNEVLVQLRLIRLRSVRPSVVVQV